MIGRFFSAAVRKTSREVEIFDQDAEAAQKQADAFSFPPMVLLQPPAAQNDDPLNGLCAGVEEDLRAAGYLK